MNVVLISAAAMLCGASVGSVIGFIVGWHFFWKKRPTEEPKIEEWGV